MYVPTYNANEISSVYETNIDANCDYIIHSYNSNMSWESS